MFGMAFPVALAFFAIAFVVIGYVFVFVLMQMSKSKGMGWLHILFYPILLTVALSTAFSGRNLSVGNWLAESSTASVSSGVTWVFRLVSVFLTAASLERISSYIFSSRRWSIASPFLIAGFCFFWICTVASPSFFSAYPGFSHEKLYTLVIGGAILFLGTQEIDLALRGARNSLVLIIVASYLIALYSFGLVFETGYSQGLFRGVPRMAGLTPHAIQLGVVAQLALICTWQMPFANRNLNRFVWFLGLLTLFLAQSKTAWVSFAVCLFVMAYIRNGRSMTRAIFDSRRPALGIAIVLSCMVALATVSGVIVFGDVAQKIDDFFYSEKGSTLLTFNGRQQIWDIALAEWARFPILGYGPSLFSLEHRLSIGMLNAVNAHNQFVDTLARAGIVGATALVLYVLTLFYYSLRCARVTQGVSVALFIILFIRGVSEVPLNMNGYGVEFVVHILLLLSISSGLFALRESGSAGRKV